jgi:hypothetical protein
MFSSIRKLPKLIEAIDTLYVNQRTIRDAHENLYTAHVKLSQTVAQLQGIDVAYESPVDGEVDKLRKEVKKLRQMVAHLVPVEER